MKFRRLGNSDLEIAPLVFGGNVFGWTLNESQSFKLLDAFVGEGFNLIDTADVYSKWAPGNIGGESEAIIGRWLKKSGKRNSVLIATKVGMALSESKKGLKKKYIFQAVEESLARLQIDCIDLYQSHCDDLGTPVVETLEAFNDLVKQGKIREFGASQFEPKRLRESLETAQKYKLKGYISLQPLYNLYDRGKFEETLAPICAEFGLGVISYYSLASGFLSGKYRNEADLSKSVRGAIRVRDGYLNKKGLKILDALDTVALKKGLPLSTIALAWVRANPQVTAPIASATTVAQLSELIKAWQVSLDEESLKILNNSSPLI